MALQLRTILPICLALIGCCLTLLPQASLQLDNSFGSILKSNKLTSIMEWKNYVRLYHKSYSSLSQELARQKIFLARVMEVFLTTFKFKFYQLSYHTAITKYSDLSPDESKKLLSGDGSDGNPHVEDEPVMTDVEARELLLDAIASGDSFTGHRNSIEAELRAERVSAMQKLRRRKRSPKSGSSDSRDLKIDDLIKFTNKQVEGDGDQLNIKRIVPPENPDYEPHVLPASSSPNNLADLPVEKIGEIEKSIHGNKSESPGALKNAYNSVVSWFSSSDKDEDDDEDVDLRDVEEEEEDGVVVIRDWRRTGCISPPIDQGYCASCYAISSMNYVEWAYCMNQENVLTPLSPQYMVSCGLQFKEETQGKMNFNGCNQGLTKQTMEFVKNYGVELEANMPYVAFETECPVKIFTPLKKKGYIRPNIKQLIRLSGKTTQLDLALKKGPVIVSMRNPTSFIVLGGGMVDSCTEDGGHAMLVIGNMIEDGTEYLVIKNSFGTDWGSGGYFKLKRSAVEQCVKEFIVPVVSFPSKKAQVRQMKAYLARTQSPEVDADENEPKLWDSERFGVDQLSLESVMM